MSLIPFLPILIPLIGALLCPLLDHLPLYQPTCRRLYTSIVGLTAVSLLVVRMQSNDIIQVIAPGADQWSLSWALLWTPLGLWAAILLSGILLLGQVSRLDQPLAKMYAVVLLVLLASSMAVMSAANLLVLSLAWSVPLLGLLSLGLVRRDNKKQQSAPWDIWASFLSTGLMIMGAIAIAPRQQGALFLSEIQPGTGLGMLALAMTFRSITGPLVGEFRRYWQIYLMLLITGLYFLLYVGSSIPADTSMALGNGLVAMALILFSLLIYIHRNRQKAFSYLFVHWIALASLGPLLEPVRGSAVSLLILIQLAASLLVFRLGDISPTKASGYGRILSLVSWASLSGVPFTMGFVAHWIFLQICWEVSSVLTLWVSVSYLFAASALWRRIRHLKAYSWQLEIGRQDYLLLGIGGIAAAILVIGGVFPGFVRMIGPGTRLDLSVLHYRQLFQIGAMDSFVLILGAALFPIAGSWALVNRMGTDPAGLVTRIHQLRHRLDVNRIYIVLEQWLDGFFRAIRYILESIESPFSLGWTLVWGLALTYYLVMR